MISSCAGLVIAPRSTSPSVSGPWRSSRVSATTRSMNAFATGSTTYTRSVDMHTWPAFVNAPQTAPRAARSMSASSQTIIGSLPPSSSVHGTSARPQASAILRPVRTEPVNAILSQPASTSAAPVAPSPVTTWNTFSGRPASANSSASASPTKGVISEGFSTTVLPAASACTDGFSASRNGKFQGVMMPDHAHRPVREHELLRLHQVKTLLLVAQQSLRVARVVGERVAGAQDLRRHRLEPRLAGVAADHVGDLRRRARPGDRARAAGSGRAPRSRARPSRPAPRVRARRRRARRRRSRLRSRRAARASQARRPRACVDRAARAESPAGATPFLRLPPAATSPPLDC